MRAAVTLAVVVVVAALAAGCGGGDGARDDVDAYIRDVNTVQQELLVALTQASAAYRSFTTAGPELAKLRPKLVEAERTLRRLDGRLDELRPPPEALRLHRLLRRLTGAQVALADELERSSAYLPAFGAALAPLDEAETTLRKELGARRSPAAQAKALRRFERAVATVLREAGRLDVPAVVVGLHETQTASLEELRESAGDLAGALEREESGTHLPGLLRRFLNAPLAAQSRAAQLARIEALKAYNARVRRVQELASDVQRERLRLQQALD